MPSPPHRHPVGAARNGLSTISQSQIQQECSPTAGLSMASSTATSPRTLPSSSSRQRNKRRRRDHPEPRAPDTPQSPSPICVLPSASSCYNPSKSTTTTTTTCASSMMMRTNDEIHSDIPLCPVMMAIIDTPYFQRLKGLKQLGTSDSTYMNANHTRFEHSLGVAHISKLMIERISHHQPRLGITAKDMLCVQLAGLLHDIGHGPYSHVYDSQFPRRLAQMMESTHPEWKHHYEKSLPTKPKDWCHEDASVMLIDAVLAFFGLTIDEQDLDVPLKSMVVLLAPGVVSYRKSPDFFRVHDAASSSAEDYDPDDDGVAAAAAAAAGGGNGANSVTPSNLFARTDCSQESSSSSATTSAGVILTSRDWIFIKEMIRHEPHIPLSKEERLADDRSGFIGRPLRSQEFLYDIVANRHHGLDTDKIDYFARDERRTQKGNGEIERRLIEEAVVAWGDCPKPHDCFRCRRLLLASPSDPTTTTSTSTADTTTKTTTTTMTMTDDTNADTNSTFMTMDTTHLMVVWPLKCAEMICGFFHKRFRNHSQVYTHKTTQASTYMICDILTLADPFYRIRPAGLPANLLAPAVTTGTATTATTGTGTTGTTGTNSTAMTATGLPISRAMLNPHTYRVLKDSIIDVLEATSDFNLEPCRRLIERWRCRDFYKCCVTQKLHPNKKGNYDNDNHNHNNNDSKYWLDQWIWNERTELEIAQELITQGGYHDGMLDSEQRSPMAPLTQEETIESASMECSDDDDDDDDNNDDNDDNNDDDNDNNNDNDGENKKKKNRKMTLEWDDIIVEKLAIHSGAGADNPVSNVRFVSRNDVGRIGGRSIDALPMAVAVQEADYEAHLPRSFIEYSLRIYCTHSEKRDLVRHVFETWWLGLREGGGGGGGGGLSSGPTATTYESMTTTTDTAATTATTSPPKEEEENGIVHELEHEPEDTPAPRAFDPDDDDISPKPMSCRPGTSTSSSSSSTNTPTTTARRDLGFTMYPPPPPPSESEEDD